MVNVTKSNFLEQSNDLMEHLPTAAFIAIDEEMTGISLPGSKRPCKDDTPSQRYQNIKTVPERYSIMQVGVALFHEDPAYNPNDENSNEFIVRRYNFYLFPPSDNRYTREVTLNPSSVAFLNQHNMNFDLWTKEGVSFVTTTVANDLMKKHRQNLQKQILAESNNNNNAINKPQDFSKRKVELTRTEDIQFHARAMASLREWIDAATNHEQQEQFLLEEEGETEGTCFLLPPCNAFRRRALYETIETEYPSLVLERGGKNAPTQIRVWRLTPEEKLTRRDRKRREEWESVVVEQIGFWRVFRAISNACRGFQETNSVALARNDLEVDVHSETTCTPANWQIPLVVHNGLMDLLFLLTHMESHALPESYQEAKALIHEYFPVVYDTKILSSECSHEHIRNDNTVLLNLYNKVVVVDSDEEDPCPKMIFANQSAAGEDDDDVTLSEQAHEAEYDAYMTGAVYAALCKRILNRRTTLSRAWKSLADNNDARVGSLVHLLAPPQDEDVRRLFGRNKLYLMLTLYTIDLESPIGDPLSRGMSPTTTFRVAGIDPSITTRDIVSCLSNLDGERRINFEIVWVDGTTFMVAARYTPNDDDDEDDDDSDEEEVDLDADEQDMEPMLKRHGQLILRALRNRFNRESIISLEEYLREQQEVLEDHEEVVPVEEGWWPLRLVVSAWNSLVGGVKREPEPFEEEPRAKRQRVS